MEDEKLYSLGAVELSGLISKKEISPVDIVKALLERIDAIDDHIKAFIHICREGAMADARQAEAELKNGDSKGLLHGIPVAYKDIYDVKGLPTTGGSIVMKGYTAEKDSATGNAIF